MSNQRGGSNLLVFKGLKMENKQFLVLTASAGSGKTYALALRYVYLLLEGAKVGEILALTFSNKAVEEMRERVGNFLLLLSRDSKDPSEQKKRDELFDALKKEYGWEKQEVQKVILPILKSYWSQTPKIITLDAFFNAIIRKFCWYVGVPYQFQIGSIEITKIEEKFFSLLNEHQKNQYIDLYFIQNRKDPFLHLNALSGKFIDLSLNVNDERITEAQNKVLDCAKEIQKAIRRCSASDSALKAVDFKTLEQLFERGKTWIIKGREFQSFKKLNLNERLFEDLREAILEFFKSKEASFLRFAQEVLPLIQKSRDFYFRKENLLDFADVTGKTYELLCTQKIPNDFFYFRLDDRISHILLDEFQDTSIIQYKILLPIIEEILSGEGRIGNRSFFAVGDEKQSIYRFRGGYGELLGMVKNLSSEIVSKNLNMNYRSAKEIVDFVNMIFGADGTGIAGYFPQESHKIGGYVKICDPIDKREEGDGVVFQKVKEEIDAFLNRGIALEDIAILVFKNEDALSLGDYLKNFYSPINTKESTFLSKKKDAQILIYALEFALYGDSLAKARLAKLLGKPLDGEVEIVEFSTLGRFIYQSMQLYCLNSSIAKQVLEIACQSQTLEDFFNEVCIFRGSQDFQDGLKILTIHGSKGLEFEHLIILDQLGGESSEKDFFFAQYDEQLQGILHTYDSRRKKFDLAYQEICQEESRRKEKEDKNLLYVALTRACKSLVLLPVIKKKGESKFSPIGIMEENEVCIPQTYGEPSSFLQKQEKQAPQEERQVFQESFGRQEGFIQKEKLSYAPNNLRAILRGEMIHKALELYLGYQADMENLLDFVKNHYGAWMEEEEFEELPLMLKKTEELLRKHFVWSEIQSEVLLIKDLNFYRIDCLLFERDQKNELKRIIILDYKSGQKSQANEAQVRFYIDLIKAQYPEVEVLGFLLYLNRFELVGI